MFPWEYCEIFNNSFFTEHLRWLILHKLQWSRDGLNFEPVACRSSYPIHWAICLLLRLHSLISCIIFIALATTWVIASFCAWFKNMQRWCSFHNAFVGFSFIVRSFGFVFISSILATDFYPIGRISRIAYSREVSCQSTRSVFISFTYVTRLSSTSKNYSTLTSSQHDKCCNKVSNSLPIPKWKLLFSAVLNPHFWKQSIIALSDTLPIPLQPVISR